jgi:hypothetical protein
VFTIPFFLLAAMFTLVGAFGQILLVRMLLKDLALSGALPGGPASVFTWLFVGLEVVLFIYAVASFYYMIDSQCRGASPPKQWSLL